MMTNRKRVGAVLLLGAGGLIYWGTTTSTRPGEGSSRNGALETNISAAKTAAPAAGTDCLRSGECFGPRIERAAITGLKIEENPP
ncbi:MAG TPA: hypothetical protein VK524_28530, partial [Polyangiaceae bacterium]|nr:hypothetical protein [Polyangiaceae bacterium]